MSTTNTPGHGNFITNGSSPYNWRSPQNDNLWQGISGTNNPCPSGYRLPTEAELNSERSSWSTNNAAGAFASPLKLPLAGSRDGINGSLYGVGSYGDYWSSTVDGANSRDLYFDSSDANMNSYYRSYGASVRCLKNLDSPSAPELTTNTVIDITATTATSGGNVTADGGSPVTSRGICWSTSANPTTANSSVASGSGTGSFTASMTGLSSSTTYYVRAYATNSVGTTYGNQVSFTTATILETEVVDVTNPTTGKIWMDRNLGASQVATSSTDALSYGDLYQWGRAADGHQIRTSATTSTLSTTNTPGHGKFIIPSSNPYDWRNPQNDNLWQGVSGTNNPCPSGYRLPTEAELNSERLSWSSNNVAGAFASPLKLPVAGYRDNSDGSLSNVGSDGFFWSSTVDGTFSRLLFFNSSSAFMNSSIRAYGLSVRCLKD
ncbi:MAG: FISUMP domain-containing protein [Bacteroidales bacterium]|nr:FISUMP domain-containing protein [Bacteroidales bacterium]